MTMTRIEETFVNMGKGKKESPAFRIGTIPGSYVSGRPTVQFDGEGAASTRTYPYLSSYTPTANHRVLLGKVGNGWVVLGRIM